MWTVVDAKAKLTEIMRRARAGEAQYIGVSDKCVVISAAHYEALLAGQHDGNRLLADMAAIGKGRGHG